MAISFVAKSQSVTGSLNVGPKPIGTAAGDLMLALVWAYEETVTAAPTEWDLREGPASTSVVSGQPERFNSYLYQKEAGASEPADYTWTTTTATGPTPDRRVVIISYRGCSITPPDNGIEDDRATHTENAGSNTLPIHSQNSAGAERRQVVLASAASLLVTGSMPSPWVERLDDDGLFLFDRRILVAGATATATLTFSQLITSWGFLALLIPEPDAPGDRHYCGSIDTQIN